MSSSESAFNRTPTPETGEETFIPIGIKGGRYEFFKTRRFGTLQFVKKLSAASIGDMVASEALLKEFGIGFSLNHPSIVRYTHYEDGTLYEEFVDGCSLKDMMENQDPRLQRKDFVEKIARQLFDAIDYLHSQGVLHLDIKPENLMITRVGNNLKIVDFGCAKSDSMDSTAGFTPKYMAPEQSLESFNCHTDIYLAGNIIKLLSESVRLPNAWNHFIDKATKTDPADRFQSASEALSVLPQDKKLRVLKKYIIGFILLAGIVVVAIVLLFYGVKSTTSGNLSSKQGNGNEGMAYTASSDRSSSFPDPLYTNNTLSTSTKKTEISNPSTSVSFEQTLRTRLERDISRYYQNHVWPLFPDTSLYQKGPRSPEFLNTLFIAMEKAETFSHDLADSLSRQHPDMANTIQTSANQIIFNQNNIVGQRLGFN